MKKWVNLDMYILVDEREEDPGLLVEKVQEEIEAALRESGNKGLLIALGWEKEDGY